GADRIPGEGAEVPEAAPPGPQERVRIEGAAVAGIDVGEARHVAPLVEGHGGVPGDPSEVADIHHGALLPEHRVDGAEPSHRPVANSRDADDLAAIVDGGGRPRPAAAHPA